VEVAEGSKRLFRAKRGGLGGRKAVYRSPGFHDRVALEGSPKPRGSSALLKPLLKDGKIVGEFESLDQIRSRVKASLEELRASQPSLTWR